MLHLRNMPAQTSMYTATFVANQYSAIHRCPFWTYSKTSDQKLVLNSLKADFYKDPCYLSSTKSYCHVTALWRVRTQLNIWLTFSPGALQSAQKSVVGRSFILEDIIQAIKVPETMQPC